MKDEILEKLVAIKEKPSLEESEIQHLFVLARKLIERQPETDRANYALLKFYCDWTLHSEIEHSKEGALLLSRIHSMILTHLKKTDNSSFASDLTTTLSLENLRNQLNNIIYKSGSSTDIFTRQKWAEIIPVLAEIISSCPLKIDTKHKTLSKIKQLIQAQPLKGTSVVEELAIIKIPNQYKIFDRHQSETALIFCFMIKTTDTTRFITPIIK